MNTIATTIIPGAERMLGLAEALLEDVPPTRFARFAAPGGQAVHANHPAFVYGHLALYPARILQAAGLDPAPLTPPASYPGLFGAGVECRDDPGGTIYPAMAEITGHFFESHRTVLDQVRGFTDAQMAGGHKIEGKLAEIFPTLGNLTAFLLMGHAMMHLGQVSTWRRAIGLGSAM
jgi:hypothetical protein